MGIEFVSKAGIFCFRMVAEQLRRPTQELIFREGTFLAGQKLPQIDPHPISFEIGHRHGRTDSLVKLP